MAFQYPSLTCLVLPGFSRWLIYIYMHCIYIYIYMCVCVYKYIYIYIHHCVSSFQLFVAFVLHLRCISTCQFETTVLSKCVLGAAKALWCSSSSFLRCFLPMPQTWVKPCLNDRTQRFPNVSRVATGGCIKDASLPSDLNFRPISQPGCIIVIGDVFWKSSRLLIILG